MLIHFRKQSVWGTIIVSLLLYSQSKSVAADPAIITAPISKCGAKLEYFSRVHSTGQEPAFQLTNRIQNKDDKTVTDLEWSKPDLSTAELKSGERLESEYAISAYERDNDAPIKFWYQGCKAPAEAYLEKNKKSEKDASLRSLIRRTADDPKNEIARAEVTVSIKPEYIQYEIVRQPADLVVGLTGVTGWLSPSAISAVGSSAKDYGYSAYIVPVFKVVNNKQLDRLHADWGKDDALFSRRNPSGKDLVIIRLPGPTSGAQLSRAKIVLVSSEGNLLATGSYTTYSRNK